MPLPVVDFGCVTSVDAMNSVTPEVRALAGQVHDALSTIGFMFVTSHGVSQEQLENVGDYTDKLFSLPDDVKQKYAYITSATNHGWVAREREILSPDRPGDIKESFEIQPQTAQAWPDEEVPGFRDCVMKFHTSCAKLAQRILCVIALALDLDDKDFFKKNHNILTKPNYTILRLLHYPEVSKADMGISDIKQKQIRCGEHTDYGSITLVFQDDVGGLQVLSRSGDWVDATPIPGAVLVNIGDLMQRWTNDKLVSTIHRVLVPETQEETYKKRNSFVCFVHPDADCIIESLDNSEKYPPIPASEYARMRLDAGYGI